MNHQWPIIELNSVDSTNNYANMLLINNEVDREIAITATYQTNGRGQQGNGWVSDDGKNIMISLVLFTNYLRVNQQFYLSQAISLGITDYLDSLGIEAKVKWPNDIFVNNLKIAGILIEHSIMGQNLMHSVVGIGLNLNQIFPLNELLKATSVKQIMGVDVDRKQALNLLLYNIQQRISDIKLYRFIEISDEYMEKLYLANERAHYSAAFGDFYGKITQVRSTGELVILADNGSEHSFLFKEVKFIE
jgi:BirA family biotin operon repressor/biotin-[acetyl-CoA-carboxylase] ligase